MLSSEEQSRREQFERLLALLLFLIDRIVTLTGRAKTQRYQDAISLLNRMEENSINSVTQQIEEFTDKSKFRQQAIRDIKRAFRSAKKSLKEISQGKISRDLPSTLASLDKISQRRLASRNSFIKDSVVINGRHFELSYYVSLVSHIQVGRARTQSILELAENTTGLVQVSNNPSVLPDCYCNEFRGKVYSVSQTSSHWPSIDVCGGGPPFHIWCYHTISPFELQNYGSDDLRSLETDPAYFKREGESLKDYQKRLWRLHND